MVVLLHLDPEALNNDSFFKVKKNCQQSKKNSRKEKKRKKMKVTL